MASPSRSVEPLKVLIVEDNRDARTTLRMLLALAYGYAVVEAADGASAVQLAIDERPNVALIDIGLPGMDGYEVARRIRTIPEFKDLLLVAVTGWGQEEDRIRSQQAGFDHHLIKPVEPETLHPLLAHPNSQA